MLRFQRGIALAAAGHADDLFDARRSEPPPSAKGSLRIAIKVLAVSGPKRKPALSDVPTFAEQGYPMLEEVAWMGLWIKPGVPVEVQDKIRQDTLKVMSQPATLRALGVKPQDLGG